MQWFDRHTYCGLFTIVNTSFISYNYHFVVAVIVRTFKIYSCSRFQVCSTRTILLTKVTALCIKAPPWIPLTMEVAPFDRLLFSSLTPTHPRELLFYSLCQLFKITHTNELTQHFSLSDIFYLSIIFLRVIHVVVNVRISFFFMVE